MKYSLFLIVILISSCNDRMNVNQQNNNKEKDKVFNLNYKFLETYDDMYLMNELTDSLLKTGDTSLYIELHHVFFNSGHQYEFLYYALFMANEYNYPLAYSDVDLIFRDKNNHPPTPKRLKRMGGYYLTKSYQLGEQNAIFNMKANFGNDFDSLSLINKMEKYMEF